MTTETMTLTVGKPLGVAPPFEGYMPVLNGASFHIIAFFSGVTIQDKKDWLVGKAQYGLYSENGIPIFLLDLGKTWSLDVYIQPKKIVRRSQRPAFNRVLLNRDALEVEMEDLIGLLFSAKYV